MAIVVSDALPIQFWPIADPTFNENTFAFVDRRKFFQKWLTTDTIKLQISNEADLTKSYTLRIKDENGNSIVDLPYTKSFLDGPSISPKLNFLNTTFPSVLTPWVNYNAGSGEVNFSWISAGLIRADGTSGSLRETAIFYQPRPDGYSFGWPPGNYQISLNGLNGSTGPNAGTMQAIAKVSNDGTIWTTLGASAAIPTGAFGFNLAFTIPNGQYYKFIGFEFNIGPPGNVIIVSLNDSHLNTAPTNEQYAVFDLEFDGDSEGIIDKYAQFFINASDGGTLDSDTLDSDTLDTISDDDNIYKSDLHYFISTIPYHQGYGTRLMFYKSSKNFAGIKYPGNDNYYSLRVPSKFYKPRNVKVTSSLPLSQSKIATTSIVSTKQQLFKTVLLPQYMLDKIELILQHCVSDGNDNGGSVIIDSIEWQADESFDRADVDEKCAFDAASTWLSKGVVRNII